MAEILPLSSAGARRVQVLLGDKLLTVRTFYQELTPIWRMDLYDENAQPLIYGVPLVSGVNLLAPYAELTRVYGEFWYVVSRGDGTEPDALGNTADVWWLAPDEIERDIQDASTDPLPFDAYAMFTDVAPA